MQEGKYTNVISCAAKLCWHTCTGTLCAQMYTFHFIEHTIHPCQMETLRHGHASALGAFVQKQAGLAATKHTGRFTFAHNFRIGQMGISF